jgi:hypothetical protein
MDNGKVDAGTGRELMWLQKDILVMGIVCLLIFSVLSSWPWYYVVIYSMLPLN